MKWIVFQRSQHAFILQLATHQALRYNIWRVLTLLASWIGSFTIVQISVLSATSSVHCIQFSQQDVNTKRGGSWRRLRRTNSKWGVPTRIWWEENRRNIFIARWNDLKFYENQIWIRVKGFQGKSVGMHCITTHAVVHVNPPPQFQQAIKF